MNKEYKSESIRKESLEGSDHSSYLEWKNSPQFVIPIALIAISVVSFLVFFVWKYAKNQRYKMSQLKAITPKASNAHLYAGIKASQPIEFVVPTITLKNDVTSYSVTEESDSDCLMQFGYNSDHNSRTLKRNSRTQINESEISKCLYDDFTKPETEAPEVNFVLHYSFMRQQLLLVRISLNSLLTIKSKVL
jgi:hypothetical protein